MTCSDEMRGGVNAPPRNVLILGVGNLLLTDDGFGVHVINALREMPLPPNVTLIEAGIVSHQMIPDFHAADLLIFIDAVEAGDTRLLNAFPRIGDGGLFEGLHALRFRMNMDVND